MVNEDYVFDFEKLEVYEMTLGFVGKVFKVYRQLSREYQYSIGDQFTRAALSIANNIAEGSGKNSKTDKGRFYGYSLDSARECVPMITLLYDEKCVDEGQYNELRQTCVSISKMLAKLIRALK